jgi:hypothetical protein
MPCIFVADVSHQIKLAPNFRRQELYANSSCDLAAVIHTSSPMAFRPLRGVRYFGDPNFKPAMSSLLESGALDLVDPQISLKRPINLEQRGYDRAYD